MAWAWEQDISATAKIILLALADHSDDDGVCWPGQRGIGRKCGVSRQTVNTRIQEMVDRNLIVITQRHREDGSLTSNIYQLNLSLTLQGSQPGRQGSQHTRQGVVKQGDRGSQPGRQQEPSVETSVRTIKEPRSRKLLSPLDDEEYIQKKVKEFADVWSEDEVVALIRKALNHKASDKWKDKHLGVSDWLSGDAKTLRDRKGVRNNAIDWTDPNLPYSPFGGHLDDYRTAKRY